MSDDPHHLPHDHRRDTNFTSPFESRVNRVRKRQNKIVEEILANRRGEYRVPTWVLTAALVAVVLTLVGLVIFA